MAVDNRPFKSKEQDGQGNEIIIRDQQLVEQGTATTMASGACFETRDVDDRPVKIPRDNMMNIVLECIGIILNDSSRNLGTNVQKALGLQGNTVGHSTVADFASVLGGEYIHVSSASELNNPLPGIHLYRVGNGDPIIFSCVIKMSENEGTGFQIRQKFSDLGKILYVRTCWSKPISWSEWQQISIV